jgi:hypothetical protein
MDALMIARLKPHDEYRSWRPDDRVTLRASLPGVTRENEFFAQVTRVRRKWPIFLTLNTNPMPSGPEAQCGVSSIEHAFSLPFIVSHIPQRDLCRRQ